MKLLNLDRLARRIKPTPTHSIPTLHLAQAKVVSTSGNTATILLRGVEISGVRWLQHHTPSAGHVVWVLRFDTDLFILGRLA